ncbi:Exo-beta-1,3-glucanase [Mycena venus]|uniref:Exo-beta-1,3-glucanase n=1 Tax=Mycena venus TaxID=2733690 RepID=A0A8H7CZF4_9AGAR|nr:Exo-beta-1,3-glucanase [Mycena venus]
MKDFGAKGDGVTDDTVAINQAITLGNRCSGGASVCNSTTITPAVIFFPSGTYLVSNSIVALYQTQLIGDAASPPTILAAESFRDAAVIDADPYIPGGNGAEFYTNQNNFFRSVRNFVIDVTRVPAELQQGTGIHWQVSQSTSLQNIVINLSTAANTAHQGIWMENGSGGFLGDLIINGGVYFINSREKLGADNYLFQGNSECGSATNNLPSAMSRSTMHKPLSLALGTGVGRIKTLTSTTAGYVGFDLSTGMANGQQTVGAEAIIDATVTNTPIFVRTGTPSNGQLIGAGSLVLNNIKLNNVPTAVGVVDGTVVLAGGTTTITSWGQGNVFKGSSATGTFTQGDIPAPPKPAVLLDSSGKIFGRGRPQYASYAISEFVSVRDQGAKGDGKTDDTAALKAVFAAFAGCKIIFFDAGTYVVTSTLEIPAGTQIVGEGWSVIAGKGSAFQDVNNPQVVVRVGAAGSTGVVEISDIVFKTIGPTPGAIVVEWNVKGSSAGSAGMWDSYIALGGADGTGLQTNCPKDGSGGFDNCYAAFMALHLTASSSAYLEGTWVWLADHNMDGDGDTQISLYSGRGILSESAGPVWMIGTGSEHHTLYQYSLVGAQNHYMGLIQTETPYYQPTPVAPNPFSVNSAFKDPSFSGVTAAWGLTVTSSSNILIFGAGLYSFYSNYAQTCLDTVDCQNQILNIDSSSSVFIYSLQTVGSTFQLSLNEAGVVNQSANPNGFAATLTAWTQ